MVALLIAGCAGDGDDDDDDGGTASIATNTICIGVGCGLAGDLRIPVYEGSSCAGAALFTITIPDVVTTSGDGFSRIISGMVQDEIYCVSVFLDTDEDGALSTGDAIDSAGGQTTIAGDDEVLTFELDALQP